MQANSDESSSLQGSLTLSYIESSKRLQRDQHNLAEILWKNTCKATTWYMEFRRSYWNSNEENITTCKVTTWCKHILRHYHIHKELQDAAIWTWCSSKGQKGQPKVNIKLVREFDVENISVKLWNDTGNFCRVIVFTRQNDRELVWKFKKVTQRSISNSSVILMWRILLSSYSLIQAIYEELSCSQGPPRCFALESLKNGHTKVKIKLGWNSDQ